LRPKLESRGGRCHCGSGSCFKDLQTTKPIAHAGLLVGVLALDDSATSLLLTAEGVECDQGRVVKYVVKYM
jgi:hypothetical protein